MKSVRPRFDKHDFVFFFCIFAQLATSVIFGLKRGNSVRFRGNSGKTWPKQSEFNQLSPKSTNKNRYPPNLDISVRFRPISARYRLVCRKPSNCQHVIFSRQTYMFPVKHTIWRNKESSWESQNAAKVLSISRPKKKRIKWYMLDACIVIEVIRRINWFWKNLQMIEERRKF